MERKSSPMTYRWDLPVTRNWMGRKKLSNPIIKREMIKLLDKDVQIAFLYLNEYYCSHGPIDIAYDAALKFSNDYSLLVLAKYLYDVDGKLVFSSLAAMNYFYLKVEGVVDIMYNNLCRRFAILYLLYYSALIVSALFMLYFTYLYI